MSTTGTEEAVARAARALRTTLLASAGASLALGVMGVLVVVLAGAETAVPGVSVLALGQLVALVAAGAAWTGMRRILAGRDPRPVTAGVRTTLGRLAVAELVALVVVAAGWVAVRPAAAVAVVACALVSAQLAALMHVLRR